MNLWDTVAPGRVKVHTRRLIWNGLAVGSELHRRKIKPGVFCVVYGREETNLHRFWSCPHSAKFWKILHSELGVPVAIPLETICSQSALSHWLLSWFAEASADERAILVQGLYALWMARNNTREGKKIDEAADMAAMVRRLMEEWQTVHGKVSKTPREVRPQRWSTPEEGWVKANVDGASTKGGEKGAVGVVFRNNEGAFLEGACHFHSMGGDPEKMELLACKRAVELAEEFNITSLHIEMDCQEVVRKLLSEEADLSVLGR